MKTFTTKDFYLSGAIMLNGFHLVDNFREQGYTVFQFKDSPELRKLVSKYYRSECKVDASIYGLTLRQLKGVIHNSVSTHNQENNNNEQGRKV